jgi:hypothetical protein
MTKVTGTVRSIGWPGEEGIADKRLALLLEDCEVVGSYMPGKTDRVVVSFRPAEEVIEVSEKLRSELGGTPQSNDERLA